MEANQLILEVAVMLASQALEVEALLWTIGPWVLVEVVFLEDLEVLEEVVSQAVVVDHLVVVP